MNLPLRYQITYGVRAKHKDYATDPEKKWELLIREVTSYELAERYVADADKHRPGFVFQIFQTVTEDHVVSTRCSSSLPKGDWYRFDTEDNQ